MNIKNQILSLIIVLVVAFAVLPDSLSTSSAVSVNANEQKPIVLSDASFQSEIKEGIVLVDFWATWCGPCRRQGPIVEELAKEFAGKVKVCKLDVDHNRETATKYYVRSIPTIIIFKDGKVVERLVGLRSKSELIKTLKVYL